VRSIYFQPERGQSKKLKSLKIVSIITSNFLEDEFNKTVKGDVSLERKKIEIRNRNVYITTVNDKMHAPSS
jgi:hypothetical protein